MGHLWGPALSKDLTPGQWSDRVRWGLENDPLDSLTGEGGMEDSQGYSETPSQPGSGWDLRR